MTYLALLRGINVGGKNVVPMADLRASLDKLGHENVRTYIQSGNILFQTQQTNRSQLSQELEKTLKKKHDCESNALILTATQYRRALNSAPNTWGSLPEWRHNICFLLNARSQSVINQIPEHNPSLEQITAGPGVIFWSVANSHYTRSRYAKLAGLPIYREMTIRNFNTAIRLRDMLSTPS